ncbi:esterase/lipase family protein [Inhella sp.]|uniref:esterase/lipase family protein n=1 Tax=Inhella sp. TaxID=1921806 RepID=UPI0035B113F2
MPPSIPRDDLRGAARLATSGTLGVTRIVEAMHARIRRPPGLAGPADGKTGGLTGLVYGSVRGVTRLVGGSLDALLALLPEAVAQAPRRPSHDALVAALNGVLGDHLAATGNPLATPMQLAHDGAPLALTRAALKARFPEPSAGLLVLVHGLCMNGRLWRRKGHDHGEFLAQALGLTPLYLTYNTGLPVAENGRQFAALMAQLLRAWPHRAPRVVILAHSMGGLVSRSAFHQAGRAAWTRRVSDFVSLGTPHLGAPLEKAGAGIDLLLGAAPYAAPLARLGKVRSRGITDLRHGLPPEVGLPDGPGGPRCWAMAGAIGQEASCLPPRLLGDGLVRVASGLGQHADPARHLPYPAERRWVAQGVGHLDLLSSRAVARRLLEWLGETPLSAPAARTRRRPSAG